MPVLDEAAEFATWPNDASFASGRIKDLIRHDFMLATENHLHPWREWPSSQEVNIANAVTNAILYDTSFDMILLDIKGKAATHMLIDFYGNYEFNYRANSHVAQFQQHSHQVYPATMAKVQQSKRLQTIKACSYSKSWR